MAYPPVHHLSFLLLIIYCMSSMTHCALLDNIVDPNIVRDITGIGQVGISGVVQCQFPSHQRNDPSLPAGLNVVLACDKDRTVISNAVTDTNGFFEITLNTLQASIFHPNQCDECRIVVKGTSIGCRAVPGRRGALLAPINCRDAVAEQLHDDKQGYVTSVHYKAKSFYFDPSY